MHIALSRGDIDALCRWPDQVWRVIIQRVGSLLNIRIRTAMGSLNTGVRHHRDVITESRDLVSRD